MCDSKPHALKPYTGTRIYWPLFKVFLWFSFTDPETVSGGSFVSYANSQAGYTIKGRRPILALILGQTTDVFDVFIVHENRASDPTAVGSPDQICRILRQLYLST